MKKYIAMCFACLYVLSSTLVFGEELGDRTNLFRPSGGLAEKLVVTDNNALLYREIGDKGEVLPPLTILWRYIIDGADEDNPVKNVDGKEYYRVGGPTGIEFGWVETSQVTSWMTRFVLAPLPPRQEAIFRVFDKSYNFESFQEADKKELEEHAVAKIDMVPPGFGSFAFVLNEKDGSAAKGSSNGDEIDSDPESFKKVLIYTGPIKEEGRRVAVSSNSAEDIELDIVFVIDTTASMTPMIEMAKKISRQIADTIQADETLSKKVHFGLVDYRDSASGHKEDAFGARVDCDLNKTYEEFLTELDKLSLGNGGDGPEEVVLGLKTAVDDISWHELSSKHIILLGDAPNKKTQKTGEINTFEKLFNYANVDVSGDDQSKAFNTKYFHAILGGNDENAEKEWQEISANGGRGAGYFGKMDNESLYAECIDILTSAFNTISDLSEGKELQTADGEIATKIWTLATMLGTNDGVAPENLLKLEGYACARSEENEKVADMNILVLRWELEDFHKSLQKAYTSFNAYIAGDGGNKKKIFDDFIEEFTGVAAGENEEYYDKNLLEILGRQFPVQTKTLKMKFKDVRNMNPEMFTKWVNDIKTAAGRAKKILDKKDAWTGTAISVGEMDDQRFAFISVADLP